MRANDGEYLMGAKIEAVKEITSGRQQGFDRLKEFAMGNFTAKVPPEHFNWVQPGAVCRQVKENQSAGRGSYHRFHLIIFMGRGIVPSDVDGSGRMLVEQPLQQLSDFSTAFPLAE